MVTRFATICALTVLIIGCAGGPVKSEISVPPGLNDSAVELAVLLAVSDRQKPSDLTVGQAITDNVLTAILGDRYSSQQRGSDWFYEGREPNKIYAGYTHRGMYLKALVSYSSESIHLDLVETRDVGHNKMAKKLLNELEDRLHRTLGMIAQQYAQQTTPRPSIAVTAPATSSSENVEGKLKTLKQAYEQGLLTKAEYDAKRKQLLEGI